MTEGWAEQTLTTATFTVELVGTSCAERLPVAPTVTQAACVTGFVRPPTLTYVPTDGISYSTAAVGRLGRAVGHGDRGVECDGDGVTGANAAGVDADLGHDGDDPVTFDWEVCSLVAPVAPTVTQATCASGVVAAPTIALPETTGIT